MTVPSAHASPTWSDAETRFVVRDGLRIAALDWGGDGPPLLFLHPNGFCAGLFEPLARRLRDTFRPIGVDLRGHGNTDAPATRDGYAFVDMADDVLAALDHLGVGEVVALGESLGGGVATLIDRQRPGAVARMLLCEAIAFDFEEGARPYEPDSSPVDGGNYMSVIARKRRAVWSDREAVRHSYESRPPFDVFEPETLAAYVHWGFRDRPDGQVELACSPEVEATIFEVSAEKDGAPAAWRHLADVSAAVTVARGDHSDLPGHWFAAQAERAGARLVTLSGGHFFLQEDTDRAEQLVREHLSA